jgi:hypothetical protein
MALPKIDVPVYDLTLPLSKQTINFRPFLVKEQKNLLMALEADDSETIEKNIKQILVNCTMSDIDIDNLPIVDIEYYFLNLRARSVGEVVDLRYRCNNEPDGINECGNIMETTLNIFDIKLQDVQEDAGLIELTKDIYIKLTYPKFSVIKNIADNSDGVDVALKMIVDCIEYIYDGEQYYYASDATKQELVEFVESLNQGQFDKLEQFFDTIPKLDKKVEMTCSKCGYNHTVYVEGLENFFV